MKSMHVAAVAVALAVIAAPASSRAGARSHAAAVSAQPTGFSDSAEADMLHRAYLILATGDHDYKGHRAKAMHHVKAAAEMLGLDLRGDVHDREKQALSDERMREADNLINQVLGSAAVGAQPKVAKRLRAASSEIHTALGIR